MDQEQTLKNQIIKCAESVKKKIKVMRDLKSSADMTLDTVLKPITEPLNKLANIGTNKDEYVFTPKKRSTPYKRPMSGGIPRRKSSTIKKETLCRYNNESSSKMSNDESEDVKSDIDAGINDNTDTMNSGFMTPESSKNISWSLDSDVDNIPCGIRQERGKLFMGNTRVSVFENQVLIGARRYAKTPGVVELLLKKNPDLSVITEDDKHNYKEMLINTSAHRRDFDPKKPIKSNKGRKYTNIIRPMFIRLAKNHPTSSEVSGAGVLPLMKKFNKTVDYIYWDDPNELVERLKLLVASYDAGNNGVHNEIISIIEELREAGIIH